MRPEHIQHFTRELHRADMEREAADPVARALAALDAMATIWAAQTGLRVNLRVLLQSPDMEQRMFDFVKQAYAEGLYAGRASHREC